MSDDELDISAEAESGHGGFRPGAGRPKGSKNRRTILTSELIDDLRLAKPDYNPLLSLVLMADEARQSDDLALARACHATVLPYLMPKLRPIEADVEAVQQLEISKAILRKAIAEDWKTLPSEEASLLSTQKFTQDLLAEFRETRIAELDEEIDREQRALDKEKQAEKADTLLDELFAQVERDRDITDLEDEALKDERRAHYKRQKAAEMRRERGLKDDDDDDDDEGLAEAEPPRESDSRTPSAYEQDRAAWQEEPAEPEPEEPEPPPEPKPTKTYRTATQYRAPQQPAPATPAPSGPPEPEDYNPFG